MSGAGARWGGSKSVEAFEPAGLPEGLPEIFRRMERAGAAACAVFGGAPRDADLGALWGEPRPIKDYDMRVWLDPERASGPDWERRFGEALLSAFEGGELSMEPSAGTGRLRHVLRWRGIELDVSARPRPSPGADSDECARERALDSDASLSAVAISSTMACWRESAYAEDRLSKVLSFYPGVEPGRLAAYSARMVAKFPGFPVRMLSHGPSEPGKPARRAAP